MGRGPKPRRPSFPRSLPHRQRRKTSEATVVIRWKGAMEWRLNSMATLLTVTLLRMQLPTNQFPYAMAIEERISITG